MRTDIGSLKEIIELAVRNGFEVQVEDAFKEIQAQMQKKFDVEIEKHRAEAKKYAQKMALEMLQRINMTGISVEFKL